MGAIPRTLTNKPVGNHDFKDGGVMQDIQEVTLQEFINKHKLAFSADWVGHRPDGLMSDRGQSHYKCKIRSGCNAMTLYFSMGSAHTKAPELAEVLDCLASDAAGYENANGFEDWASEYGYDTDSRSAEKIWRAVQRESKQLKRVLGEEAYQQLLWNTARL